MYSKKDYLCFLCAIVLVASACFLMIADPVPYGFGILTLWIAPPLLFAGFMLPVAGIIGVEQIYWRRFMQAVNGMRTPHLVGAIMFFIALGAYVITLEPTASLWDCSEFIASAYKLQVPHSPGNPFFLLIARLFSMLATNPMDVAFMVNLSSAIFSALTVYIVFRLICLFGPRITNGRNDKTVISGAAVGSLCLTFSDSFWFSAVEAETYACASFFLMLLVWLIVSGCTTQGEVRSRRFVLIFYVAGLSYCVHPMCLVALPLLPFYWYTRPDNLTLRNVIVTVGIGLVIVVVINRSIAVGFFEFLFSFDLFFVNSLHLPFYSGALAAILLCIALFIFLVRRFRSRVHYTWAAIFLLAGFLPYLVLFIRSNHNPPIDETNPENLALIKAYMNRESYMAAPLIYGPYFDAEIENISVKANMYYKDSNAYKIAGTTSEYEHDRKRQTIFPRMYSNEENNIGEYRQWTGLRENELPSFADNLEFMFRFQLGEMYFRYLLFNFAGRESDVQYSAWLKPWESVTGPVPNKARNQYWMIPLLLVTVGAFFQYQKNKKDFLTILIFFSVTGWLLAAYLNSPPNEPRERDYIYVGSFIACSIWIGLAVAGLVARFSRDKVSFYTLSILVMMVPGWMAYQNFDDHDRSGRTFQMDNARNLLQSCAPNSVLFTGGDNDTFPLWYLQEVEGFRTDVRVMVLSYLNTDWYVEQLRRSYYNSAAFNLTLSPKDYLQYGANDVIYVQESIKEGIDVKKYLQLLSEEHPALRMVSAGGEPYSILPSRSLTIPVDKFVLGTYVSTRPEENVGKMSLTIKGNYITKNSLAILDLMVSNNWDRPIYFNFTSFNQVDLNIKPYLVQEGLVYRLMPFENHSKDVEPNTNLMYKNLVTNANYENLKREDIYLNHEDFHARMIDPLRSAFNLLIAGLIYEGEEEKANAVMDKALRNLYSDHLKPSFSNLQTADLLLAMDRTNEAQRLSTDLFDWNFQQVEADLADKKTIGQIDIFLLQRSVEILAKAGRPEYATKLQELVQR